MKNDYGTTPNSKILPFTSTELSDQQARGQGLYGIEILRAAESRHIQIQSSEGTRWVVDFLTNSPFALNLRPEVMQGALEAVKNFGAIHASVASARAGTGLITLISKHLSSLKGPQSEARLYPTTFSANIATAVGLAKMDCTVVVHPNVHATVQFALKGAFDSGRIIRSKNTPEVASAFAKTTRRSVVIVEDGLYSMGNFADFNGLKKFLDGNANGMLWLDDAHSVGMRGKFGRGEAMEQMYSHTHRTLVTGSFGKTFGAAGGFLAAPQSFVQTLLGVSVSDRFSCNLDIAAQGALWAAMQVLAKPGEVERLQNELQLRLDRLDSALHAIRVKTAQAGTSIAFRVIPFADPEESIHAAGLLLNKAGFLATPIYYPTIARGAGAIRLSLSAGHKLSDVDTLIAVLVPLLKEQELKIQSAKEVV